MLIPANAQDTEDRTYKTSHNIHACKIINILQRCMVMSHTEEPNTHHRTIHHVHICTTNNISLCSVHIYMYSQYSVLGISEVSVLNMHLYNQQHFVQCAPIQSTRCFTYEFISQTKIHFIYSTVFCTIQIIQVVNTAAYS